MEKYIDSIKRKDFNKLRKLENISKKQIFLISILILSYVLLDTKKIIILSLLAIDLIISKWMAEYGPSGIGIETASLATILAGIKISPLMGAIIGISAILLRISVGLSGIFILWKLPGFALLGFLSGLYINSLIPFGIILLALIRIGFIAASKLLMNKAIGLKITFTVTNLIFIYFLSTRLTSLKLI